MKRLGWWGLACAAAMTLVGCQQPQRTTTLPPYEPPALIERAALFGNPERTGAQISPKGDFISFLAPKDGYLNVFVYPTGGDIAQARAITNDVTRGIRQYFWAENGTHVLYLQDEGGDENWRLYSVDVQSGARLDLTPLAGVQAQVVGMSPREPDVVLVGLNDRDPAWHDIYRIDVKTGRRTLIRRNTEEFFQFIPDEDNVLRLATKSLPNGASEVWSYSAQGAWTKLFDIAFEDSLTSFPIDFEADGKSFLMLDATGRDRAALVRVDAATGARTVLGESQRADVSDVWIDPVTQTAEAYAAEYLRTEWTPLTDEARGDLAFLRERMTENFSVTSRTQDDGKWIVIERGPTRPGTAHLYDRGAGTLTKLFDVRPALANATLAPMIPVEIAARDGLTLVSYLTLPPGADADGNGRPDRPVPLVLNVHGGPWARDSYDFDNEHQWLANRGYAVLAVNFRGSTGFGKAFVNAGNREWAGKMHDDLIDAVNWAVAEGVTTADRVAIYGGSYGGYATLTGLTFTPDQFACGVSIVGPSNLETLLASVPPYWEAFRAQLTLRVGDPATAEGRALLRDRSPLNRADQIRRPLLIAQGANDPRVKQAESDQIVQAMKSRDIPVTYVIYPDEGHGFARPTNRMSFYAISEAFLGQCLGGRAEPVGDDFAGASLQVAEGAALVPGLEAALAAMAAPAPGMQPAASPN